jgi:hypothetical protein
MVQTVLSILRELRLRSFVEKIVAIEIHGTEISWVSCLIDFLYHIMQCNVYLGTQKNGCSDGGSFVIYASNFHVCLWECLMLQGLKALHSPHTGIVDWGYVTEVYADNFKRRGGVVRLGFEVSRFEESRDSPDYPVTVVGQNAVSFSYIWYTMHLQRCQVDCAQWTACNQFGWVFIVVVGLVVYCAFRLKFLLQARLFVNVQTIF